MTGSWTVNEKKNIVKPINDMIMKTFIRALLPLDIRMNSLDGNLLGSFVRWKFAWIFPMEIRMDPSSVGYSHGPFFR